MQSKTRRFASIVIICALLVLIPGTAMAQEANTTKEEVIYASLQANGSFQKAYVVNSFDLAQAGQVVDYGNYDSVTNLTTTDKINRQGDQIAVGAPAGRFFYQGDLNKVTLPWDVSISYTLDGSPVEAKDLAGKSGHLQISLNIKDRADANQVFIKNYMLQSSITLDTEKCSNITAEKATLANSGKNKVITFIKMPNSDGDYTVQADVQNFEMQGIQIAGLPLSLGISTPDTGNLTSGIGDLQNGISSLDSGADSLSSGAQKLNEGSGGLTKGLQQLQGGMGTLQSGMASLVSGNSGLQGGSQQILDALKTIQTNLSSISIDTSDLSQLATGSATIAASIKQMSDGLASLKGSFASADSGISAVTGKNLHDTNQAAITALSGITDPALQAQVGVALSALNADDGLISGLKTGINGNGSASNPGLAAGMSALNTQYASFDAGIQALPTKLASMAAGMTQLKDGIDQLVTNYASFNGGLVKYTNGAESLYEGYGQICDGFNKIVQGSAQLSAGASSLAGGTKDFSGGMDELNGKTKNMDSDMQKQIDDMMKTYTGGDFTPVSFVSDKNTNIKSVQFVMITDEIKAVKAAEVQQQAPQQSFWDKLAALFNIKK